LNKRLNIKSIYKKYSVTFIDSINEKLQELVTDGDIILVDSLVHEMIPDLNNINAIIIKVEATENQKSFENLGEIIDRIISTGFRKNNRIFVIGGGIVQDVSAFISSILFRGVSWYFFPTTLLAMADSCIGGKTSINLSGYKNQLGNFYPPDEVFISVYSLEGLSELAIRSGVGEMLHYFLVSGESDLAIFLENYKYALDRSPRELEELIYRSLKIKKQFIEVDEFDGNERLVLNYGHTFGHAIEALSNYSIPHGIAVSHGMDMANFLSKEKRYINESEYLRIRTILETVWGQIIPNKFDCTEFISVLKMDKKSIGGDLRLILTKGVGKMFIERTSIDTSFSNFLKSYMDINFS